MKGFATIIFSKAVKLKLFKRKECRRGSLAVKAGLLFFGYVFFLRVTFGAEVVHNLLVAESGELQSKLASASQNFLLSSI